jgi:sulfopyruvate decarboxylase subunit beta
VLAKEAMELALDAFGPDAVFVCANGYVSREAFNIRDEKRNFYMLGSMGLASSIALGAALAKPEVKVVVLDGDGNLLMGLGALALVGTQAPANLFHVCVDNGVYASTGNQPTVAPEVCLEGIAREAGYRYAERAETPSEAAEKLAALAGQSGPGFLRLLVEPEGHPRTFDRVSYDCEEIHARFASALRGES